MIEAALTAGERTTTALVAVAGLFGVTLLIGIVSLVLAEGPLLGVARTAARDVSKSFWVGVFGHSWRCPCWWSAAPRWC